MDTSKEYIVMIEASPIQERWKPDKGDWIATRQDHPSIFVICGDSPDDLYFSASA